MRACLIAFGILASLQTVRAEVILAVDLDLWKFIREYEAGLDEKVKSDLKFVFFKSLVDQYEMHLEL